MDITDMMETIGVNARAAARDLATASAADKETALRAAADAVWEQRNIILEANAKDMDFGAEKGLSPAMMDRLMLDEGRIQGMVDGLRAVAAQSDPIGEVTASWTQPTGLHISRVRTPLA